MEIKTSKGKLEVPEHDLFIQHIILKNTLRKLIGEETIDYLE